MSLGIVMLVHTALDRAEQVARHWSASGCPVVIHVDRNVTRSAHDNFISALADLPDVRFSPRFRCEWGTWGIVAATQAASELMLASFGTVRHVYLASGSCLPLRPVRDLIDYLDQRPTVDFIESATTSEVPWAVSGLDEERFTLRFPFSWKRNRYLFDKTVAVQRFLKIKRRVPNDVIPHMGSQWWCLTRHTLASILQDPARPLYDRYFKQVWIPDESYFQTLARQHTTEIESRSLTLSKFDFQGKPHIFYDDHLHLLRRSDCFVARKIWPHAERLYSTFLNDPAATAIREPNPGKIDRVFARAVDLRTRGRAGLYMHSRFPNQDWENGVTAARYSVFEGFAELFEDFEEWLSRASGAQVHGHLFAADKVYYAGQQTEVSGALSDSAALRDYSSKAFLTNLIWNTRGERQCFQFGPADTQDVSWSIARDANAQISVITGAWAVPLFRSNLEFSRIRSEAALLQKTEASHLNILRSPHTKAQVRIWSMAEFIEAPMESLQIILDEIGRSDIERLSEAPRMVNLTGFGQFLQHLKNQGMHPYLTGDFAIEAGAAKPAALVRKPYLVR